MQKSTPKKSEAFDSLDPVEGFGVIPTHQIEGIEVNANLNQASAQTAAAAEILGEIAQVAARCDKLARMAGVDDLDEAEVMIGVLRDAINRIGWLADRGVGEANAAQIVGGADDWMLPPVVAAIARMERAGVEAH